MGERGFQFEAAAAYIADVFAEQAKWNVLGQGCPRLVDLLFGREDAAGENESAGTLAAGNEAFLHQKRIDADSLGMRHPFDSIILLIVDDVAG
jgi:hypothetical protein